MLPINAAFIIIIIATALNDSLFILILGFKFFKLIWFTLAAIIIDQNGIKILRYMSTLCPLSTANKII